MHLGVSSPNFLIQESIEAMDGFAADVLKRPLVVEDGFVVPPSEPGLGVELDDEVTARHPYTGDRLHLEVSDDEEPEFAGLGTPPPTARPARRDVSSKINARYRCKLRGDEGAPGRPGVHRRPPSGSRPVRLGGAVDRRRAGGGVVCQAGRRSGEHRRIRFDVRADGNLGPGRLPVHHPRGAYDHD